MKTWVIASALLLLVSASSPAKPEIELSQLTGEWIMEENGRWVRETWGVPTATGIEGTGSSGTAIRAETSEKMRITKDDKGGVTLFVKLGKAKSETPFKLVSTAYQQLMFENLKHDYPQRIIYSRDGGWLFATIMKADGSRSEEFSYRPVSPPSSKGKPMPNLRQAETAVTFARKCVDSDGYTNCGMPMRTHIRNMVCWSVANTAGYSEPYRNSPAAECSFESRELRHMTSKNQPDYPWHANWARLHFITAHNCTGHRCKREWHIPRN